jgi:DNA ligase (NAD+)
LLDSGFEIPSVPVGASRNAALAGKIFVFTGGLIGLSREVAKQLVEERGGRVSSSVSKKTSYVVAGEEAGSKLEQARNMGVAVLTEQEFQQLIEQS